MCVCVRESVRTLLVFELTLLATLGAVCVLKIINSSQVSYMITCSDRVCFPEGQMLGHFTFLDSLRAQVLC